MQAGSLLTRLAFAGALVFPIFTCDERHSRTILEPEGSGGLVHVNVTNDTHEKIFLLPVWSDRIELGTHYVNPVEVLPGDRLEMNRYRSAPQDGSFPILNESHRPRAEVQYRLQRVPSAYYEEQTVTLRVAAPNVPWTLDATSDRPDVLQVVSVRNF